MVKKISKKVQNNKPKNLKLYLIKGIKLQIKFKTFYQTETRLNNRTVQFQSVL